MNFEEENEFNEGKNEHTNDKAKKNKDVNDSSMKEI